MSPAEFAEFLYAAEVEARGVHPGKNRFGVESWCSWDGLGERSRGARVVAAGEGLRLLGVVEEGQLIRMSVTKRLRFEIFRRDGFRCTYCGFTADESESGLHVDHVIPVALGGKDEPGNLTTSCIDCNAGKTSVAPNQDYVDTVADNFLSWRQHQEDLIRANLEASGLGPGASELWKHTEALIEAFFGWMPEDDEIHRSVTIWHSAGYPTDMLAEVATTQMPRKGIEGRWRYFCGIIWNQIRAAEQDAS